MKSRNERLWDAYCVFMRDDAPQWMSAMQTAESAVNYFDAHCPREDAEPIRAESDRKVSEELSDPVRAAAVAWFEARGKMRKASADELRREALREHNYQHIAQYYTALADLLDAVAAERGAVKSDAESFADFSRKSIDAFSCDDEVKIAAFSNAELWKDVGPSQEDKARRDQERDYADHQAWKALQIKSANAPLAAPPSPNWRALVIELREACLRQSPAWNFSNPNDWMAANERRAACAVSALIAALDDEPEGGGLTAHERMWADVHRASDIYYGKWVEARDQRDESRAALEATRKECGALRDRIDREQKLVFQWEREHTSVAIALEATRKELAEAREQLTVVGSETSIAAKDMREILGASQEEWGVDAARRVVAERDEAREQRRRADNSREINAGVLRSLRIIMGVPEMACIMTFATALVSERDTLKSQLAALQAKCDCIKPIDVVFDGPPSHTSGRFVEVEDMQRRSLNIGHWVDRGDGMWALRFQVLTGTRDASQKAGA